MGGTGPIGLIILFTIVLSLLQIYFLFSAFRSFKLNSFIEKSAGIRNLIVGVILVIGSVYFQVVIETFLSSKNAIKSDEAMGIANLKFLLYFFILIGLGGIMYFINRYKKNLKYLIASAFLIPALNLKVFAYDLPNSTKIFGLSQNIYTDA